MITTYENQKLFCPVCVRHKPMSRFKRSVFINPLTDEEEYRFGNICTDCRKPIRMATGSPKHIDPPTDGTEIIDNLARKING